MSDAGWALVTGAGRRIGRELALTCARAGYDVVVHGRDAASGAGTAADVRALGARAEPAVADLRDACFCAAMMASAPRPLTLLVNCASLFEDDRVGAIEPARWDETLAVNLRAPDPAQPGLRRGPARRVGPG